MKWLNILVSLNALLQVVLKAIRGISLQKGTKKIEEEIAAKDDQKTKKELEEIL